MFILPLMREYLLFQSDHYGTFNKVFFGRCGCNIELVIFLLISIKDILSISSEIALRCMPKDLNDN